MRRQRRQLQLQIVQAQVGEIVQRVCFHIRYSLPTPPDGLQTAAVVRFWRDGLLQPARLRRVLRPAVRAADGAALPQARTGSDSPADGRVPRAARHPRRDCARDRRRRRRDPARAAQARRRARGQPRALTGIRREAARLLREAGLERRVERRLDDIAVDGGGRAGRHRRAPPRRPLLPRLRAAARAAADRARRVLVFSYPPRNVVSRLVAARTSVQAAAAGVPHFAIHLRDARRLRRSPRHRGAPATLRRPRAARLTARARLRPREPGAAV